MYDSSLKASIYDLMYRNVYQKHASLFLRLISRYQAPGKHLLDLCCGTGSHLEIYQKFGYVVEGVDVNESMVDLARKKLGDGAIHLGDMRFFVSQKKYDIITCHSFSILHNTILNDLEKTVRNCHSLLNPSGILVFDILDRSIDTQSAKPGNIEDIDLDPDSPLFSRYSDEFEVSYDVRWSCSDSKERLLVSVSLIVEDRGNVEKMEETMEMGAFSIDRVIDCMREIGFNVRAFVKSSTHVQERAGNEAEAVIVAVKR